MVSSKTKWRASLVWLLSVLTLFVWGCGGSASGKAAMAPESAGGGGDAVATAAAEPEADRAGSRDEEAPRDAVYNAGGMPPPAPGRPGVAQAGPAPAPPPPVTKPAPGEAGKKAEERERPDSGQPLPPGSEAGASAGGDPKTLAGPLLIYRANIFMAVFESKKSIDAVEKLAKENGGYLVSREDNRITVRVPTGKFDGTIAQIAKLGDLLHRNVNVQDVTDEYFDMQTRLRNLEVVRARFEELLKKAANVTEAVAVERELERVTGEIERLKGRLKLLKELVIFSTITVEFQPRPIDHVNSKVRLPFPWLGQLGLSELLRL